MTPAALSTETFVAVSSLLTGIAKDKLAPGLDPTDLKTLYFEFAKSKDAASLGTLLKTFQANAGKPDAEIAAAIFTSDVAWFARSVMLEWYLGAWYDPGALEAYARAAASGTPKPQPDGVVIASLAYTRGFAWSVAQAHPMGYSDLRFGYWSQAPIALNDFVGGET